MKPQGPRNPPVKAAEPKRDGFEVVSLANTDVVHFVECDKDGTMRDKVERGLLLRVDPTRFFVRDTRG